MLEIHPIPAFQDNYIWIIHNKSHAIVVDPGQSKPVFDYLEKHQLILTAILVTHHHYDHIDGIQKLLDAYSISIYAPQDDRINYPTIIVNEGDTINFNIPKILLHVKNTPGHTLSHIIYHNKDLLFCGDTLFSIGCGRMYEGTAEQMSDSLFKISQLDENIKIYCTHEYTLENIRFALMLEPNNQELISYQKHITKLRQNNLPSLPTTLKREKRLNPFLRTHTRTIQNSIKQHRNIIISSSIEAFKELRLWKDNF